MEELTKEEIKTLKTLCEFLFDDMYQYWATYERFELCFQPLFKNLEINLYEAYKGIVGEKKKYFTYPRFAASYLKYKNNKEEFKENNPDLHKFFDNIFNKILKSVNSYVGIHQDYSNESENNIISLSTKRGGKKEEIYNDSFISKIQVINDNYDRIRGIILEFDDINKFELYPNEHIDDLLIGLELNLGIIQNEYYILSKKLSQDNFNISFYRDSVTHIFGTIDKTKNLITFLGFKCVSGKTRFFGSPDGDSFLFGEFGKKFFNLRLEINKEEGITLFEPGFIPNIRKNYVLKNIGDKIEKNEVEKNLFEENLLNNMEEDEYNKLLTTTIIENENNFNTPEDDEIPGYDYKEIIELSNRDWISNKEKSEGSGNLIDSNDDLELCFNSSSDKISGNLINYNQDPEVKRIFSYNPSQNPFFHKELESENLKPYNPFFDDSKILFRLSGKPLISHKRISLKPKDELLKKLKSKSEKLEQKMSINDKIKQKSKLRDIFKETNFNHFMEKLSKNIYEEFYKTKNINFIKFSVLNEVVPNEINEREKNRNKKIKTKKNREFIINGEKLKLNDVKINEKNNQNLDEVREENLINSDVLILKQNINYDFEKFKNLNNKENDDYWIKKWQKFFNLIKRPAAIIFPIMGKIIRAMIKVFKEDINKITLAKKIEYYNILADKDNENIVNFLVKGFAGKRNKKENEENEENKKDEILDDLELKKANSLEDFDKPIGNLKDLILKGKNNKNLKNLKTKLKNLIFEKNIYVENIINIETEDLKDNLLDDNNLKSNFLEEQRNRNRWEMEEEKKFLQNSIYISDIVFDFKNEIKNKNKSYYFHGQDNIEKNADPEFPPVEKSLCPNMNDENKLPEKVIKSDIKHWELIKWKNYDHINIFSKNTFPQLDNIRQGEYIGDCYFLSALGSLCEKGNYLKNLVRRIKKSPNLNVYEVKLNINGKWKYVLVDNYFPNISNNGKYMFCFGSSFKKELWVSLFEKAWAKINGCYARIGCGGMCGEAFDILTDAYSEYHHILGIDNEQKENIWNKLKDANKNNYVICAGTKRFGFWEGFGLFLGLISQHAYTIIKIYDEIYNKIHYKLIKLRNPWGEKEFNGDWSDKSSKWTNELKKKFEFDTVSDDGIFYMSYDDFLRYFKSLEILKIKENYTTIASCKIKKTEAYKCQMIEFEINNKNKNNFNKKTFINLYQKNRRIVMKNEKNRKNGKNEKYHPEYHPDPVKSFIILAEKISEDNYKFIKSVSGTRVHIAIEADLEIGKKYIIFCDVNYRFVYDEVYGYNITFYSDISNEIKVRNVTNEINGIKRSEIFMKVLNNYAEKNFKENFEQKNEENGIIDLYRIKQFNEVFPFIILLIKYKESRKSDKYNVYLSLELNTNLKTKEMCFYNSSEASEFDSYLIKKITNKNTIILIMGYTLTDVFSLSFGFHFNKKSHPSNIFNNEFKTRNDGNLQHYIASVEDSKGFILGLENVKNKELKFNIEFYGLNIINPEYDNSINDEIQNVIIGKGEKKEFHFRLKPGCGEYNYYINYLNN